IVAKKIVASAQIDHELRTDTPVILHEKARFFVAPEVARLAEKDLDRAGRVSQEIGDIRVLQIGDLDVDAPRAALGKDAAEFERVLTCMAGILFFDAPE